MDKKVILQYVFYALFFLAHSLAMAQLDWQRDDFEGTIDRNWWRWYDDGPNTPFPSINEGYVLFSLIDPVEWYDPYCDAAFWDGWPDPSGPYQEVRVKLRVKALNPHKYGSRGWGLWYTEDPPEKQRQAWFMQMLDDPNETGLDWWRAETSNGRTEDTHHYVELDESPFNIDIQEWHTYEIVRETNYIELLIDGNTVLYTTEDLPTENMAFHIWVDNLVYEHVDPDIINVHKRGWIGKNEIVLDYVQIRTTGQYGSSESPAGIKLLRELPNEMGNGNSQFLWKTYDFSSPGGRNVVLLTGRVEQYLDENSQPISDDDDIRVVYDGQDYGWDTQNSLDGDQAGTVSKTLLLEKDLTSGNKTVEVYGDITPLLYDVTVIGSEGGGIIFDQEYNETRTGGDDSLWKDIDFLSHAGEVAIYISGSADEDPTPSPASRYGYQYSHFNDQECDHMWIELDGNDYGGYMSENALWGNRQFGEPRSILITENLSRGEHNLKIYAHNTPDLNRVVIYGENDDVPLPVTLTKFEVNALNTSNKITWRTESEINNLGFNLYKAFSKSEKAVENLEFVKLNQQIIPGSGTTNEPHNYSYEDTEVKNGWYYWYQLEDVDFNGKSERHGVRKIFRPITQIEKFNLYQNFPNPFNESTTIRYDLRTSTEVEWWIYSVSSQLIEHEKIGIQNSGAHSIPWNAQNSEGTHLTSGIYYFKLAAGNYVKTIPMLLIK